MLSKRGQFILIVALEIIAAVFASFLLFNTSMSWATGEAAEKMYFSKDLALLSDTLFASSDITIFYYKDNVSMFDVKFKQNAVGISTGEFDNTGSIYYFTPFKNSSINSVTKKPIAVVLTRAGANLSVGSEEDELLSSFSKRSVNLLEYEDVKVNDSKQVVISPYNPKMSGFVRQVFYPTLRDVLQGFDVKYSETPASSAGVLIALDNVTDASTINIFYPVTSDNVIDKKSRKLAFILYNQLSGVGKYKVTINPSSGVFSFDQVGLELGLSDDVVRDQELMFWIYNVLEEYYK
jgi:hypothetical protein